MRAPRWVRRALVALNVALALYVLGGVAASILLPKVGLPLWAVRVVSAVFEAPFVALMGRF